MMTTNSDYLSRILLRLRSFRELSGLTSSQVEQRLILGPGWVNAIEGGEILPSLDVIASLLAVYGKTLTDLADGSGESVPKIYRSISAVAIGEDLHIHFNYSQYDATYILHQANISQFNQVVCTLRNGLARLSALHSQAEDSDVINAIKSESVADAFMQAIRLWPTANPSDLWWFLVYRAYCDQYNHPSEYSRLDFTQSWKRTAGWALEQVLVRHYADTLSRHGINLYIADTDRITSLLDGIDVGHRLEADKMDVLLTVGSGTSERFIGVVHVKASFAERRTDDVPMSHALVEAGYISPLWTMDCKSMPSAHPNNRGELGSIYTGDGADRRSAKRKDIEDDGYFSACFSYNKKTLPTPDTYAANARIYVCDFTNPMDTFVEFILSEWQRFQREHPA